MTWKGVMGDQRIFFSKFNGNTWSPPADIAGANTNVGTSLTTLGNNVVMTWKGVMGDQRIFFSKFNGNTWSPPADIAGANTNVGTSLAILH
jgi:hypothetical protein